MSRSAMELEEFLIPPSTWDTNKDVPKRALVLAAGGTAEGVPTGIGYHPEEGWYVLQCGQGPYILWREDAT